MIDYDNENDRTFVIESAIKNSLGTPDEIRLYEQLSVALELIEEDFEIVESSINNGISFGIATRFPYELPEKVAILLFNIDINFNISINETSKLVYSSKRYFEITINKL